MIHPIREMAVRELVEREIDDPEFVTEVIDRILQFGRDWGASDIHLQPMSDGLTVKFRIDGVLQDAGTFPVSVAASLIARLKVLSDLLTYRNDTPQEGRIRTSENASEREIEMRVSTFPTLHGERAVVRLFAGPGKYRRLADLGFPKEVRESLERVLGETSGAILVTGPAGSGKTTTVYACLRELAAREDIPRCLISLEDPIEMAVDGVAQSQVRETAGLDLATGLRFLMRQDPEVIMVGELRDRATAEAAFQASLTGHLLLSTFHAGSTVEAIGRLSDMGIEPYVLRSGLLAILSQRLVRRLCECAKLGEAVEDKLGLPIERFWLPNGCSLCGGTGFQGRTVLVEMLTIERSELGRAILSRSDSAELERLAIQAGMVTRWERARHAVESKQTSPAEIRRVYGFAESVS